MDRELAGHVVAGGVFDLEVAGDVVGVDARGDLGRVLGLVAGDRVLDVVDDEAVGHDALGGLLGAVVDVAGRGVGLEGHLVLGVAVGHLEAAVGGGDVVVVGHVDVAVLDGHGLDRGGRGARGGLAAGERHVGLVALDQALAADVVAGVGGGQRLAVVLLLAALGGHGDGALGDLELAVLGVDRELAGHVVAGGVFDLEVAGDVVGVDARGDLGRVLGLVAGDRVLDVVDDEAVGHDALGGLLGAVVDVAGRGVGLEGHLVLGVAVGHLEAAVGGGDVVVVGHVDVAVLDGHGLDRGGRGARGGLAAGERHVGLVALDQALAADVVAGVGGGQRLAVVLLLAALGGHGDGALGDLERADSLLINEVIRLFSRATPIDLICIIGSSDIGTTSDNNKGGGLIIDQARKLSAFCSNQRSAIVELRIIGRNNRNRGFFYNQSRLASFNHFELICNVGARRFLKNAHPRIVYGALIRPHVGALCKRLYARNRIATHVKSGNSKPSIALFRSTVGFLRFIAEKLDGDDALPLRDKRNVAIRHNHAGNTSRINVSCIFIFPSRKDIPISRGIRNEGDTGAYLLNGRFVLDSTIRKSATVGLVRQCLRVGDITRIERG